LLLALIKFAR
jgi:hypothetical protein